MTERVWRRCGHPFTAENRVSVGDGRMRCKICRRAIALRSKAKRKAEKAAEGKS